MNAFQIREWWRYRRAAKGRHGVHSPFVYRLINEGLRPGVPKHLRQQFRLLLGSGHKYAYAKTLYCCLKFLGPASMHFVGKQQRLLQIATVLENAGVAIAQEANASSDCILLDCCDAEKTETTFSENAAGLKKGLLFIVSDIHASPHNALQWLRLREDAQVNLSIDLWHIGLLFYRPDFKERQHFVLKYPA